MAPLQGFLYFGNLTRGVTPGWDNAAPVVLGSGRANGPSTSQPGPPAQDLDVGIIGGLKARHHGKYSRSMDGPGLQPLGGS